MPHVFVYGPDTTQARVYDRIGPADLIGGAVLEGWSLEFNKPNMKHPEEGLANIAQRPGGIVFGLVYDLTTKQIDMLDGYFGGYTRKNVEVRLTDTETDERRNAATWTARRTKTGLRPSKTTLELTEKGAKENHAPEAFRLGLEGIEVLDD